MSASRTSPASKPWPMRRGNNVPHVFRWVDDGGPVSLFGVDLRLRITLFDGTVIDKRAGTDPEFVILDDGSTVTRGMFSYQPSLALTRQLPLEPSARYEFEARQGGLEWCIGTGQIVLAPGENADG